MESCPLCSNGQKSVHRGAHRLLHDALRVVSMRAHERDAFLGRFRVENGDRQADEFEALVEIVRGGAKR